MHRFVYRVEVHKRQLARRPGGVPQVFVDRRVGQLTHEVALPVPLHSFGQKTVEQALQRGNGIWLIQSSNGAGSAVRTGCMAASPSCCVPA